MGSGRIGRRGDENDLGDIQPLKLFHQAREASGTVAQPMRLTTPTRFGGKLNRMRVGEQRNGQRRGHCVGQVLTHCYGYDCRGFGLEFPATALSSSALVETVGQDKKFKGERIYFAIEHSLIANVGQLLRRISRKLDTAEQK